MNEPDQTLLLSQLAMARTNAQLGASHCQEATQLGAIVGLTEIPKINLARVHFELAFEQLTRALQSLSVFSVSSVNSVLIPEASTTPTPQESPSLPEIQSVIKTPADTASCEAEANHSGGEGVLSAVSASISNLKSQI